MNSPFTDFLSLKQITENYNQQSDEVLTNSPFLNSEDLESFESGNNDFFHEEESFYENESPEIEGESAIELNSKFSQDLGWGNYIYQINDLLLKAIGQSGRSLGASDFTRAISTWKRQNGFPFWSIAGVIDMEVWKKMASLIGISPIIFSIKELYAKIDLSAIGLSFEAFKTACNGYRKLDQQGKLKNNRILSIADFTQSSKAKRLYMVDLLGGKLISRVKVAHGSKSVKPGGPYDIATRFSNTKGSNQSSLGFYVTDLTFSMRDHLDKRGKPQRRGLSLFIDGMEKEFNSNARTRAVVIHAAEYIKEGDDRYNGNSWGCPAIAYTEQNFVIDTIKNGTCFFIYFNDPNYLSRSAFVPDLTFGPLPGSSSEYEQYSEAENFDELSETMTQEAIDESEMMFEGEVPKLFDVDAAFGTTEYLNVSAVKGTSLLTGVFIPAGFKPSEKVDLVLYMHGMYRHGNYKNGIEHYWKNYSNIRECFYQAKRNAILIAPTLTSNPETTSILLKTTNGLDNFINNCFKELIAKRYLPVCALPSRIILAGHSAGGSPLSSILRNTNSLLANVTECWGFDCFYNYSWPVVLDKNMGKVIYHYWAYKSDGTQSGPGWRSDELQKKYTIQLKSIAPAKGIFHQQVIEYAWKNQINKRTWFDAASALSVPASHEFVETETTQFEQEPFYKTYDREEDLEQLESMRDGKNINDNYANEAEAYYEEEEAMDYETPSVNSWTLIQGGAVDISIGGNGDLWVIGTRKIGSDNEIYKWNGAAWQKTDGAAIRITVAPDGRPWVINSKGQIFRRDANVWTNVPGITANDISIGADNSVWITGGAITGSDYRIYKWNGSGWTVLPDGLAVRIAVAPDGSPWVINSSGQIYKRDGSSWTRICGFARDIGIGANGAIWIIGTNRIGADYGIYKRDSANNKWETVTGAAVAICVTKDGMPYIVNSVSSIYKGV